MKSNCPSCPLRARYDRNPKSIIGRFWKWHIRFCPGWKSYLASLPDNEREKVKDTYK